jgi:hypothetical protein
MGPRRREREALINMPRTKSSARYGLHMLRVEQIAERDWRALVQDLETRLWEVLHPNTTQDIARQGAINWAKAEMEIAIGSSKADEHHVGRWADESAESDAVWNKRMRDAGLSSKIRTYDDAHLRIAFTSDLGLHAVPEPPQPSPTKSMGR